MYCRDCKYALKGLTERRCPECGRSFDPRNSRSFLHSPHERLEETTSKLLFGMALTVGSVIMLAVFGVVVAAIILVFAFGH